MTVNGRKYRQLVESRWDPVKQRSTTRFIRQLGPVIEKGGREHVVPTGPRVQSFLSARSIGELAIYYSLAEEFRIRDCVEAATGSRQTADAVLVLTLNQLTGRRPLDGIHTWVTSTPLPRWADLDPEEFRKKDLTDAMDRVCVINDEGRFSLALNVQQQAVQAWRRRIGREPARLCFYYDITRITWNGAPNYWAEPGYGPRKGRPHLGYGLVTSQSNMMPVLGLPVKGSKHDSTTFPDVVDSLRGWRLPRLNFVLDRGFASEENLAYASDAKVDVLVGCPETSLDVRKALRKWPEAAIELRDQVVQASKNSVVYAKGWRGELYGQEGLLVVALDPARRNRERTNRDVAVQNLQRARSRGRVTQLREILGPVVKASPGRRGWRIDVEREASERRADGRFLLFTTDTKLGAEDVVRIYRQRDEVEKAFRTGKGQTCLGRVKYREPGRVEAYLSVVNFLAYELRAAGAWKLRQTGIPHSLDDVIKEASEIAEVEFLSGSERMRRWTHVSDELAKLVRPFRLSKLAP